MIKKIATISCAILVLLLASCNNSNYAKNSTSGDKVNNAEHVNYEDLPEPTGYKRGSLVFYYFKIDDNIYTSSSEEVDSADDLWKVQGKRDDVEAKLQNAGYNKLAEIESTIDDIPEENLQGHGFISGDAVYRNPQDEHDYLYIVTETPKSLYNELAEEAKVYWVIVMRPWSEDELNGRAK